MENYDHFCSGEPPVPVSPHTSQHLNAELEQCEVDGCVAAADVIGSVLTEHCTTEPDEAVASCHIGSGDAVRGDGKSAESCNFAPDASLASDNNMSNEMSFDAEQDAVNMKQNMDAKEIDSGSTGREASVLDDVEQTPVYASNGTCPSTGIYMHETLGNFIQLIQMI